MTALAADPGQPDYDAGLEGADDTEYREVTGDHARTGETPMALALMEALPIARPLTDLEYWDARDAELVALRLAQERAEAAKGLLAKAQALRVSAGFPERAVERALNPGETEAQAAARRFIARDKSALVLAGGTGTGKTSSATWLALHHGGSNPAFLRAGEFEARGRYDKELRNWLRGKTMLVLDDIGAEPMDGKAYFRGLLDETIDMFYGHKRRLVITTNLTARIPEPKPGEAKPKVRPEPQFLERYGERIASRLFEVGSWAGCGNHDLRRHPLPKLPSDHTPKET